MTMSYAEIFLLMNFPEITGSRWDYAVFGEIIEHIDDPVHFLKTFRQRFGGSVNRFIITVPNIYNKQHFTNMLKYREVINSDHRYWFTPVYYFKGSGISRIHSGKNNFFESEQSDPDATCNQKNQENCRNEDQISFLFI